MEVYKMEDRFVLGVNGGEIYSLKSDPKAVISTKRPIPSKWWTINTINDTNFVKGEEWTVETEFREFICDERKVYILQFEYSRSNPGYARGIAEFFVTEEYASEKIDSLRKTSTVTEYSWDAAVPTWKEVHRKES